MTTATVDTVATATAPARPDALARLRNELVALEKNAREAARRRLAGSRLESLVEKFPAQLEGEVDALLGRVGLVRKARVAAAPADVAAAPAADVAAVVVADVAVAVAAVEEVGALVPDVVVEAPKKSRKS